VTYDHLPDRINPDRINPGRVDDVAFLAVHCHPEDADQPPSNRRPQRDDARST
jgi:hypothetical protein